MMNDPTLTPAPSREEILWGFIWLGISNLLLPLALSLGNSLLPEPLSGGMLNFVFFAMNFAAVLWIFRVFLRQNMTVALERVFLTLWYAVLAYLAYQVLTEFVTNLILAVDSDFGNVNDANLQEMMAQDLVPLGLGTVLLVPVAEESLYRGLIWRKLYDKSPIGAYLVSIVLFSLVHVVGYIGTYPPLTLVFCFVQYIPAAFCLCWCYKRSGTILSPILMHTMVNATSVFYFMR